MCPIKSLPNVNNGVPNIDQYITLVIYSYSIINFNRYKTKKKIF